MISLYSKIVKIQETQKIFLRNKIYHLEDGSLLSKLVARFFFNITIKRNF